MRTRLALPAVFLLVSLPVAAQPTAARPAPTDPAAPVPPVRYESAFTGYSAFRDAEVGSWRELNDQAERIGGHIGIMRGAGRVGQPAMPPQSAPKAPDGAQRK